MKKIIVDRERCTGLGVCESIAPEVFEVGNDGSVVPRSSRVEDGEADVETAKGIGEAVVTGTRACRRP